MPKLTWERDSNGGGFTGRLCGYVAYVLTNGTWTLYCAGELVPVATGRAASVASAKLAASRILNPKAGT